MEEKEKTEEMKEAMQELHRRLEREQEELQTRQDELKGMMLALKATEDVLEENRRLQGRVEELQGLLQEEKERGTKLEMLLNEMSKLSASVAGKASQEEVLKALRVFVNKSKRKKMEKRIAVKEMVLELANANGLLLPEDLSATIDSLDDEQPQVEPSQVNITDDMSELFTPQAQVLWKRLREAGFIVADGYALANGVSANQAAYIATAMAEKLQIKKKWKLFQQFWGLPNMAQLAGSWQQTGKLPPRSGEIDKLME